MQFFEYYDDFRLAKKRGHTRYLEAFNQSQTAETFFHESIWTEQVMAARCILGRNQRASDYHVMLSEQMLAEQWWVRLGRPYIKVYPKMAQVLSRIRLNVPMSLLKLPYPCFSIRLSAEEGKMLCEKPGDPPVQSLFIFQSFEYPIPSPWMIKLSRLSRQGLDAREIAKQMLPINPRPTNPMKFVSLYYTTGHGMYDMSDKFVQLYYDPNKTIAETLDDTMADDKRPIALSDQVYESEYQPSHAFIRKLWSLMLASCLMIEGDADNILPDLPKKLVPKYEAAQKLSPEQREKINREIMAKAAKSGHVGVSIGEKREIELPRPVRERSERPEGEEGKHWELQYGYVRSAHPRLQPFGSRENPKYKVIIVDLAEVRPDLPLDPRPRHYRLTDRSVEP